MQRKPAAYILASKRNGTLYVGVTSNIENMNPEWRDLWADFDATD